MLLMMLLMIGIVLQVIKNEVQTRYLNKIKFIQNFFLREFFVRLNLTVDLKLEG